MRKTEIAFHKGYRVDEDGVLYGMKGGVNATDTDKHGYLRFTIRVGVNPRSVHVHRLQAYQKFGPEMFREGIQVRHLNGDTRDNSWSNIAIGTASENMMDIPVGVRRARALYAGRARSSLTVEQVREIRRLREEGRSYAELMAEFGIAKSTVSCIVCEKTWCDA